MTRKKILLVDDSSTILMMEKFILRNGPYELVTATNGEEGVRKAAEHLPDLILLDVIMPKMGGFEACRLLRTTRATSEIPIRLLVTAASRNERDAIFQRARAAERCGSRERFDEQASVGFDHAPRREFIRIRRDLSSSAVAVEKLPRPPHHGA